MIKLSLQAKMHLYDHIETGLTYYENELIRFNNESREFLSSTTASILEKQITSKIDMYKEIKNAVDKIEVINE